MTAKKPFNIGLIGYGFMGRTHSNAYKRVNDFFDLAYRPVLKAVCGRSEKNAREFADHWQYESIETDWRTLVAQRHRRDRYLHAQQHARRDRDRRREGREDRALRETVVDGSQARLGDGRGD